MSNTANRSGTQSGTTSKAPAKKKTLTRVGRFEAWTPTHQARVLADSGLTLGQFQKLGAADRAAAVDKAISAGATLDAPGGLTTVPTLRQATQQGTAAAQAEYAPQQAVLSQTQANVDPWFQDYQSRLAGNATSAQNYAAPIVSQAQAFQQNTGSQLPPGLDPNSAAGQQAAQAAQGRQALAQLGTGALQANAAATNDYFAGLGTAAAQQVPQVKQGLANQQVALDQQKGNAIQSYLDSARTNAQNYGIAQATLGANVANQTADNTVSQENADTAKQNADTSATQATTKTKTASTTPNKYGIMPDQWASWSASHRQRVIEAFDKSGTADKTQAATQKKEAAINKSTGSVQNKITDINAALTTKFNVNASVPTKGAPLNPLTGQPSSFTKTTRSSTPAEQKTAAVKKYGATLVEISTAISRGTPLTSDQIRYLHNTDPNLRIPSQWLHGKAKQSPGISSDPGPK